MATSITPICNHLALNPECLTFTGSFPPRIPSIASLSFEGPYLIDLHQTPTPTPFSVTLSHPPHIISSIPSAPRKGSLQLHLPRPRATDGAKTTQAEPTSSSATVPIPPCSPEPQQTTVSPQQLSFQLYPSLSPLPETAENPSQIDPRSRSYTQAGPSTSSTASAAHPIFASPEGQVRICEQCVQLCESFQMINNIFHSLTTQMNELCRLVHSSR